MFFVHLCKKPCYGVCCLHALPSKRVLPYLKLPSSARCLQLQRCPAWAGLLELSCPWAGILAPRRHHFPLLRCSSRMTIALWQRTHGNSSAIVKEHAEVLVAGRRFSLALQLL